MITGIHSMVPMLRQPIVKDLFKRSEQIEHSGAVSVYTGLSCMKCRKSIYLIEGSQDFWIELWFKDEIKKIENRLCIKCYQKEERIGLGKIRRCRVCGCEFYSKGNRICSDNNMECIKKYYRKKRVQEDIDLSDDFITSVLHRSGLNAITKEHIIEKRALIKINRQIKKYKQHEKQQQQINAH